jgi:hypothetical protein
MFVLVTLAFVATTAAACVDTTPITDVPADASDAGIDVSVSPAVAADACFACTTGGAGGAAGCKDEFATCTGDPKCLAVFLCGIPRGCYAPGQDLIACLTSCGVAAGLTGIGDPAVAPFLALHACATTACPSACSPSRP